jgi:predicted dinucleotide-binding enzyme
MNPVTALSRRAFLGLGGSAALFAWLKPLSALAQAGGAMKIGVIGSGRIGGTVGGLWVKSGHEVLFSSRHPEQLKGLVEGLGPRARAGKVEEAAAFGQAILLAVPYAAIPQIGRDYARQLAGKVILDSCNPIEARDGEIVKEALANGVGETSKKYLPGTRLVRAFASFGFNRLASDSNRAGERIGVPVAGDDPEAIKVAEKLVRDAGFEPVTVPLKRAGEFTPPGGALSRLVLPASELKQKAGIK